MRGHLAFVLFSLFVNARITVELTWSTEKLSNTCWKSKNQLLMWNFTGGVNETITELQWFFNDTTLICLDSQIIGFHVETLYDGRVERNGTAGILLKNVSLNDAGKYTLYVKLVEEKIRNIQNIFLTFDEQVPYQCKPITEIHPQNVIYCSTTCFERSQSSPEWIINRTRDPVGNGRHLINAEINEQEFCCLRGLKCHDDDQFKFCMPNPIPSNIFTSKEDVHTRRQNETNTVKATIYENNVLIILVVMIPAFLLFVVITVTYFVWRRHKSLDVKPKKSNTAEECTEELQQVETVAKTTDRSSHDSNSNQNGQIGDNISMNADILKYMVDSQRLFLTELEAVSEESKKLKRHSIKLQMKLTDRFVMMTEVKYHHYSHNDTDTSETSSEYEDAVSNDTDMSESHSDFEDAVSEPLVEHDKSGSIDSRLSCGSSSSDQY